MNPLTTLRHERHVDRLEHDQPDEQRETDDERKVRRDAMSTPGREG